MSLILDGTNGLSDVDGSAATPAIRGTDANTGIFFPAADTIAFAEGGVEAMRLDASGNLGLGVTPSASNLAGFLEGGYGTFGQTTSLGTSIAGNAYYNSGWKYKISSTPATLQLQDSGGFKWNIAASGTAGNAITFTQAMTLDSSGNLLVGTTTSAGKLTVLQSASAQTTYFSNSNASPFGVQIQYTGAAPNNAGNEFIYCADTANNRFIVYATGNAANRNNVYGAISDVKLKENIVDASPKLADLMQVKVRNYNLIGETTKQIGVVAQELETVFPSMVEESPDKDNERNNLSTTTKSVKYSVFVPMLIKAIQEQQAIIESLKARLDAANL